ncbi:carboxypeptidase-like regulatory domain-containing protein [Ancylomarina sp. 16SWW S1-10-2]|uniref:carboxypeptidase-like regulatory domain-containing protein n=1 Tax=Ancylomarina sp. 16SWW S1-10-2 TaxID=2499681 RepID=UPI0012AE43DD|nr:carboxypeptidase-like regulatory domain-containing protein [Ancylomarina sp. 16SWW S1-10-2]MRT93216.1 carboxypeptidase-like regulatory domain-containing protein [Ancylomarina sp. 16SWW S1-10-2]
MLGISIHTFNKAKAKRLIIFLCFFTASVISLAQNKDLNQKITICLKEISLENALDSIAQKTNTYFTYDARILQNKALVNIEVKEVVLAVVLRQIIPDTTLNFQQINKQIIIFPTKQKNNRETHILKPQLQFKKVKGRVVNKKNKNALAYASIGIKGKTIGTISNIDGDFLLNLPEKYFKDTLTFSFIGFKNTEIPIHEIKNNELSIELRENLISLQEVVIRNTAPLALLKSSINRFDKNYPNHPSRLTAFYRESVSKNKNYMIYLESILDIYKSAYQSTYRMDMAKVFQSRKIYDSSRLDTVSLRLKGGVDACLHLDIIKNRIDFLDTDNFHLYNFHLADISSFDNHPVYVIHFEPKGSNSLLLMQGDIFIDTRSLAIIRAEFSYPSSRIGELKNHFIAHKSSKTKVKPLRIGYAVSYKNINGKYYLNHTKGNLKFKVRHKHQFFAKTFETNFEMAVTLVDTTNIKSFKYRERLHPNTVMSKSKQPYDATFWGTQNYIEPEENIQQALKRINTNLKQVAKKDN